MAATAKGWWPGWRVNELPGLGRMGELHGQGKQSSRWFYRQTGLGGCTMVAWILDIPLFLLAATWDRLGSREKTYNDDDSLVEG